MKNSWHSTEHSVLGNHLADLEVCQKARTPSPLTFCQTSKNLQSHTANLGILDSKNSQKAESSLLKKLAPLVLRGETEAIQDSKDSTDSRSGIKREATASLLDSLNLIQTESKSLESLKKSEDLVESQDYLQ